MPPASPPGAALPAQVELFIVTSPFRTYTPPPTPLVAELPASVQLFKVLVPKTL